ncbi:cytidylate kinase [Galbibacter marinus]|uniref:Cytidylate kinase n=1 Tax=Galbibacter marinus TaxID=555500 RepID=K2PS01_9FLAO|nr:(d)CMP kinase [Galbibacter marinus]EKF55295.1 cytidylate kinase [Galbibacter marinus]
MRKITIAIDGYSSTGKSTIAKKLAKSLGYVYVDTGAMYRAVSYYALINDMFRNQELQKDQLIQALDKIRLEFKLNSNTGLPEIYLNGDLVEKQIRTLEVSHVVSEVAAVSEVRHKLVEQQQAMGKNKAIVMDGRDVGTVIFPDAELKLFMTASADVRAHRRYLELTERGDQVTYQAVLENVQKRDLIDTTRSDSPLMKADGAIEIDSTNLSLEETFQRCLKLSNETLQSLG